MCGLFITRQSIAWQSMRGQVLLGHTKLSTTARYTQVATKTIRDTVSPFEALKTLQGRSLRQGPR